MNIKIEKAKDVQELAIFITEMNQGKEAHIGYCGREYEWNLAALEEDFRADDGSLHFFTAEGNSGEILAALGIDFDESIAEVWGPFNKTNESDLENQLWEQLVTEYPDVTTYTFFINEENLKQQSFMERVQAENRGKHLQLKVKKSDFTNEETIKSVSFEGKDTSAFVKLHDEAFPGTYYDAKTIISRLRNGNFLKVLKNAAGELQGYAYVELDEELNEASLEYISISPNFRGQGIGTVLLKEILTEIFSYPGFTEVNLVVEGINEAANRLYFSAGFTIEDTLISYRFTRKA